LHLEHFSELWEPGNHSRCAD